MENKIIMRVAKIGGGDVTYITNRLGYVQASKDGKTKIIFAIEYDNAADAQREIARY
jgi:hypothetical protein